jgi:glycerophosphoryl diester phosphodiesterase
LPRRLLRRVNRISLRVKCFERSATGIYTQFLTGNYFLSFLHMPYFFNGYQKQHINRSMKFIFLITLFVPFSITGYAQDRSPSLPATKNTFIVIAHRGNHVNVHEIYVASILEAIKAGADYAEIDLRTTRDGYLVLSHDATVDRTTNGNGQVKDLTLAEIKNLRLIPRIPLDTTVYRIPEFSEILQHCKNKINIYLDFKDADVTETYRLLKAAGMEKQVVVYLNRDAQYSQWINTAPAVPLMSSIPDTIKTKARLQQFLSGITLKVVDNIYDAAWIVAARKKGVSVWLDVESADENPAIWQKAMSHGIQGMQTDHPEALIKYLNEKKLRNRSRR